MKTVPLSQLENAIVRPGFEKYLTPLLYYRGAYTLGRAHRMYNFAVAAMLAECETAADMTQRLAHNPDYSHLLGPAARPQLSTLRAFYGRLLDNPHIANETPGLLDFVRSTAPPWTTRLDRLSRITHDPRVRWVGDWRIYVPRESERKPREPRKFVLREKPADLVYPFAIHDGGKPEHEMVRLVNDIVPKGLPPDMRADICQDLIVGMLTGHFTKGDLYKPMKQIMREVQAASPSKWGDWSLDAVVPGTDGLRLIDTI